MSKKARGIIISVVVLAVVAGAAIIIVPKVLSSKRRSAYAGFTGGIGRAGSMYYTVTTQNVATSTSVSGTIQPARTATLSADAAGKITAVYKKEGDTVKAGELIAQIDSTSRDNQLAQAESNYRTSLLNIEAANTTDLTATKTQLETALKQAQIQELQAENSLKNATVYSTSATTTANLQEAVTRAEENLSIDQASLKALQNSSTPAVSQPDIAVQQAQLNLTAAQNQLVADAVAGKDTTADLAAVDRDRLALESANASAAADTSVAQSNLKLENAQTQVNQDERAVTTAQNNLAENQKTLDSQANNVTVLQADVDSAKAAVTAAQYNLSQFSTTQRKAAVQLQVLQEQKNQAQLSLQATQLASDNYTVTAPYTGVITSLNVATGDVVTAGTSVAVMADQATWNVEAYVDESDILNVKVGQDAAVTIDPYSGKTFAGKVISIGHTLQTSSSSVAAYPVKVQLTQPPTTLEAGMSADAAITVSVVKGVLAVPSAAVITLNNRNYVLLISVDANNKRTTTRTEVKVGVEGDDYTQILSGLKSGDRIMSDASTATSTSTTTTSSSSSSTTRGGGVRVFGGGL
ncbi:MAG: efflux RND transporter periplasmic adaptor subunit [Candidatus Cryosericum sp.]